ncbi:MAG TPA: YggT family protein [Verrucomicrobiae bacterium]|nr:YggT family protein [Verrucomicrobiae bacterium]
MQEDKQTTEVRETNTRVGGTNVQRETVSQRTSTPGAIIFKRVVWYITGVIIALLVLRLILLMLAANDTNAFVSFIYGLSGFFAAPFFGIFSYQPTYGQFTFEVSTVVAIIVYALIGWGIAKLATLSRPQGEV